MALDQERLVRRQQGGWDVLWPAGLAPVGHPGVAAQYSVRTSGGPTVAGYPTRAVEVRKNGALRETLFVEASRGLLLRRDQFGETGDLERRVEFETVVIDGPPQAPQAPPRGVRATAVRATSAASLPSWSRAPARLPVSRSLRDYRSSAVSPEKRAPTSDSVSPKSWSVYWCAGLTPVAPPPAERARIASAAAPVNGRPK